MRKWLAILNSFIAILAAACGSAVAPTVAPTQPDTAIPANPASPSVIATATALPPTAIPAGIALQPGKAAFLHSYADW
ncbi:MAG: hypothetical protein AAF787_19085 [Chloroflexota bacterium]